MGHTNRTTINARKPMSHRMIFLLKAMAKQPWPARGVGQGDKSRLRALMDRGYASPDGSVSQKWHITDAGVAALKELGELQ